MIGQLYNFVETQIVGQVPIEFEFIIPIIVILFICCILFSVFSGFIILKDLIK